MKGRLIAAGLALAAVVGGAHATDLKRAEEIVGGRCFICHGMEGEAASALYPRLAAQHAEYIAKQLGDFKSGKRKSETMAGMAADLTPEEMKALGQFFQKKPATRSDAADADLAGVGRYIFTKGNPYSGVAACVSCHGPKGYGTPLLPRLAGQQALYLENQLKQFNTRERNNDNAVMHSIASKLTELEVKAVASYISTLD
ncbi:cytochrome c [Zoogloea sp.]|uniref:c-type cytochrome n=1 Tax=Zoogloea sp. TaxID=49181 RepID=UPI0035AE522F